MEKTLQFSFGVCLRKKNKLCRTGQLVIIILEIVSDKFYKKLYLKKEKKITFALNFTPGLCGRLLVISKKVMSKVGSNKNQ